jgi:hypothetical protein
MRLKAPVPPLAWVAVGLSALAIFATVFVVHGARSGPDRCTDAEARAVALSRFREDPTARVTGLLHYTGATSVFVRTAGSGRPFVVGLDCGDGRWRIETVYRG